MTGFVALAPSDIAEVMRLERLAGYEAFIGRFTAEEHAAEMARPQSRYFGWREGDGLAGFVIFQELDRTPALLRRIAVGRPGRGLGTELLRAALAWAFETHGASTIVLDVRPDNLRARRVYEREGFAFEGERDGRLALALSRDQWAARRRSQA